MSNLNGKPVYIFSGLYDTTVVPARQEAQKKFFEAFNANVEFETANLGHKVPKAQVKNMFEFVLTNLQTGALSSLAAADPDWASKGILRRYTQADFSEGMIWESSALSPFGYIYYPKYCYEDANAKCKVHVFIHGCWGAIRVDGIEVLTSDYEGRDFNALAAANNVIIVYPDF